MPNRCWCCGLGGLAGGTSLCGHCKDAGCNRFDDYCEAAETTITGTEHNEESQK